MTERPLSVVHGRDKDVLPVLLSVHAVSDPHILDCTYNKGRMSLTFDKVWFYLANR